MAPLARSKTDMTPTPALSLVQLGRRVLLVLGICGLLMVTAWLWVSWQNVRQAQLQRVTVGASLAAGQSQSFLETISSHLEGLAARLRQDDLFRHPENVLGALKAFVKQHPELSGASLIMPNGQMVASTALKPGERLPNVLDHPDWRADFYENLNARGLSINRPQQGYLLRAWILPLRYTVRDAAGEVVFLLQTSVLLEKQQAIWANVGARPGVQFGLVRDDGVLLSIWPIPASGFDPKHIDVKPIAEAIHQNFSNGFFVARGAEWRETREGAYQRLRSLPAYTFVSTQNGLVRQIWWQAIQIPVYVLMALFAVCLLTYGLVATRFVRRMQAIREKLQQGIFFSGADIPTSGVREIDELCEALADTQVRLESAAQTRERQLLTAADAGTYTVRLRDGVVVQADDGFLGMLGRRREEVLLRPWSALFDDGDVLTGTSTGQFSREELSLRVLRFKHAQGGVTWLSLAEYIDDTAGEPLRHGLAINVSEREKLLTKVQLTSDRLRALWRLATDRDSFSSDKVRQMLQLGLDAIGAEVAVIGELNGDDLVIRHLADTALLFQEGQHINLAYTPCDLVVRHQRSLFVENAMAHPDVRSYPAVAALSARAYGSAPIWVGDTLYGTLVFMSRRVRERMFSEEDRAFVELLAAWFGKTLFEQRQRQILETMAMTDSLTGLPNRRAAEARMSNELARAKRGNEHFSVAICDLDRFKLINDHFGHDVGDMVLRHVAAIMHQTLREGDWVARWGGEEFIIFLHQSTASEAFNAMERLREEIKQRSLDTPPGRLDLSASFGIGVYAGGEMEMAQILSEADGCLYEAKRRGRDRVVMSETTAKGLLWQAGMLQRALHEQRIMPAYQVMVELASGKVVADEALARLVQADGAVLPAVDFVEAAEGINLIHVVDNVIARSALDRCCGRGALHASRPAVHFINLSPQFLARRDLLDALLADAREMEQRSGVNFAQCQPIVFEVTERQLMEDFGNLREDLKHLLEFGFRLALDDFGSGYSSFLYLAELPISFLKIEGWMIRNMRHNDRVLSMVKSIVMLAKTLRITTIAECVEDGVTAEILRDMGVDWGQGYYFGYPQFDNPGTPAALVESEG